jgi:UDP-N-acetylmuramoyl-L-alanyl-D-glutamate--2,6-diaminopimelate ligase
MKLKKLLKDLPVQITKGSKEIEVTGICSHSKLVSPGNLFIAKRGLSCDGSTFIADAISAGASAVLSDIYNPFLRDVVQIVHPDPALLEAEIAARFYHHPDRSLFLVGITGTNGKTTTSYLIKHLLDSLEGNCGLIGTIERIVGKNVFPSTLTTSDVITNYKLFFEMQASGCKAAVMEVSSHALDQGRVRSIEFDAAVFTNLTQDHLDYHHTMEQYADAKAKLFSSLHKTGNKPFAKTAIVNSDTPWHKIMLQKCCVPVLTYGLNPSADLVAKEITLSPQGMRFTVCFQGKTYPFHSSLIGRYNIYNCLAAMAVGLSRGFSLEKILSLLTRFTQVSGRLERVANTAGLNIFVDYAHTDDALRNVLETLQEVKKGKIITVFGCGGNRDQGKRPKMGSIAEKLSDAVIVTSDNPRSEDPNAIIQQILTGFSSSNKPIAIPDRAAAIAAAIQSASKEDIVLIAGKGHETHQIFAHQTIPFDDRLVAQQICAHK